MPVCACCCHPTGVLTPLAKPPVFAGFALLYVTSGITLFPNVFFAARQFR
jgi:hypothetical protein